MTKFGSASASIVDLDPNMPQTSTAPQAAVARRRDQAAPEDGAPQPAAKPTRPPSPHRSVVPAGSITAQVIEKFERAYENDGIFESKVSSTGTDSCASS